ncbi:MAG: HPr family phosphocarrier protein [Alphaproteobacteria bacterium]|nr:HPr family phosphocarrier protein [Alphaproteobacteria bacterium]
MAAEGAEGGKSLEKTVKICNRRGLHARAAAKFVRMVDDFRQRDDTLRVRVLKDDMDVCGSSIMGLLMLSASIDTSIRITASGEGAQAALDELSGLVERRFDEEA